MYVRKKFTGQEENNVDIHFDFCWFRLCQQLHCLQPAVAPTMVALTTPTRKEEVWCWQCWPSSGEGRHDRQETSRSVWPCPEPAALRNTSHYLPASKPSQQQHKQKTNKSFKQTQQNTHIFNKFHTNTPTRNKKHLHTSIQFVNNFHCA